MDCEAMQPLQGGMGWVQPGPGPKKSISKFELSMLVIFDVILALAKTASEVWLVKGYLEGGDTLYAAFTIFAMALPGALEFLYFLREFRNGEILLCEFLRGVVLSVFFPVAVPLRLAFHLLLHTCGPCCCCGGSSGGKHMHQFKVTARTKALNNMSHLTKGPLQLIFQAAIIMKEWNNKNSLYHLDQSVTIVFNIIMMARTLVDNYYFVVSGKNLNAPAPVPETLRKYIWAILHLVIRGPITALLTAYLGPWILLPCASWIFFNWRAAKYILRTDWNKHIYTAFAGLLAPTAFISRDTIRDRGGKGPQLWANYVRCNSLLFLVGLLILLPLTDLYLLYNLHSKTCTDFPFTFYSQEIMCPASSEVPTWDSNTSSWPIHGWIEDISEMLPDDMRPQLYQHKWFFLLQPIMVLTAMVDFILVCCE